MLIKEKNSAKLCSMHWHDLKQLLLCHYWDLTCFLCSVSSVFLQMASMCPIKSHLCLYRKGMYYVHISVPRWNQNTFMCNSDLLGKKGILTGEENGSKPQAVLYSKMRTCCPLVETCSASMCSQNWVPCIFLQKWF